MQATQNFKLNIYCDGGSRGNPGPAAGAFVAVKQGEVIYESSRFLGTTTNNVAEYTAVNDALEWLTSNNNNPYNELVFFLDSELVVKQLSGEYKIKSPKLKPLAIKVKELEKKVASVVSYKHVPRNKNKLADGLVNKQLNKSLSEN